MIKLKLSLFCAILLFTGCPSESGEPDNSEPIAALSFAWNPAVIWPDIDLPNITTVAVSKYTQIPDHAVAIGTDNIGDGQLLNHRAFSYMVIEPGDYSKLGRISLTTSGTPDEPRVLYCLEGDCVFDAFDFVEVENWVLIGIQFESYDNERDGVKYTNLTRLKFSDHIVFHDCHWRNMISGIRMYGNYNTVQYCSFSDKPDFAFDIGGVGIYARDGQESRGNRVLFCEFKGCSDGVGVPWDTGGDGGSTPATVIAYNTSWVPTHLYRTLIVKDEQGDEQQWTMACAEDGYDIKNGALTDALADRSYFIGNISIGHRVTDQTCGGSGSAGTGILMHRRARNWLVQGNLIYDDALGTFVKGYPNNPDSKDRVENIELRNNAFINLGGHFPGGIDGYRENPNDRLAIRVMCPYCLVADNLVSGAKREVFEGVTKASFTGNQYFDIEQPVTDKASPGTKEVKIEILRSPILDPEDVVEISFRVSG